MYSLLATFGKASGAGAVTVVVAALIMRLMMYVGERAKPWMWITACGVLGGLAVAFAIMSGMLDLGLAWEGFKKCLH
jgi:hypothetical protein